jgi:hypothetical protein
MNEAVDRLRARREALLRRTDEQRQELAGHLEFLNRTLDRADRGLDVVRRVATPPVLIAAGVAVTVLLGRGRARRLLAAGLTILAFALRARSAGQMLAGLAADQAVSRSR